MADIDPLQTLKNIGEKKPLVHHITNWVTIMDCAQVTRRWGALPVMAHAREEVEDMVKLASALVLNIGTLTPELVEAMLAAARAANKKGIPVVLDPVGAGATPLRTKEALRLTSEAHIDVLKGNAGEIATLAGVKAEVRGVESMGVSGSPPEVARSLAARLGNVVAITGATDYVSNGKTVLAIENGHPMMGEVVGTGCMSTSTVGCFVAAGGDPMLRVVEGLACFGIAGERAAKKCRGAGDFIPTMFNEIAAMVMKPGKLPVKVKEIK